MAIATFIFGLLLGGTVVYFFMRRKGSRAELLEQAQGLTGARPRVPPK